MKTTFIVTAQTARKTWDRTVETKAAADALAAEWTAQYRAQCTVAVREEGFMPCGRFDTTKTIGRTETAAHADARHARSIRRAFPDVTTAEMSTLLDLPCVVSGDWDSSTLAVHIKALRAA